MFNGASSTISTGPFLIANCWHNQRVFKLFNRNIPQVTGFSEVRFFEVAGHRGTPLSILHGLPKVWQQGRAMFEGSEGSSDVDGGMTVPWPVQGASASTAVPPKKGSRSTRLWKIVQVNMRPQSTWKKWHLFHFKRQYWWIDMIDICWDLSVIGHAGLSHAIREAILNCYPHLY